MPKKNSQKPTPPSRGHSRGRRIPPPSYMATADVKKLLQQCDAMKLTCFNDDWSLMEAYSITAADAGFSSIRDMLSLAFDTHPPSDPDSLCAVRHRKELRLFLDDEQSLEFFIPLSYPVKDAYSRMCEDLFAELKMKFVEYGKQISE